MTMLGFLIGLADLSRTFSRVGDEAYLLMATSGAVVNDTWRHALHESIGGVAVMVSVLYIYFAGPPSRTPTTWVVVMILLVGHYAPFWIGTPFLPELGAPHWRAELIHILMAAFPLAGALIARPVFMTNKS
ncbi:hypothetical protein [uncultured Pseudoteredinibacter sp.]|uniref:hypothetical protein n=1 Tax=uncultured Pseudoteredinibacter sp. TaxID=1641701 RepID=UPI00262F41D4|nr:hypothetical protein [uncultured Pseudoteredinibacter sp.]